MRVRTGRPSRAHSPTPGRQPRAGFPLFPVRHTPSDKWNDLAHSAGLLGPSDRLRDFQIECANTVLVKKQDVCIIAPTGAGKSMVWCLPILKQKWGISLVITPYTTLGNEGADR